MGQDPKTSELTPNRSSDESERDLCAAKLIAFASHPRAMSLSATCARANSSVEVAATGDDADGCCGGAPTDVGEGRYGDTNRDADGVGLDVSTLD
jgi:hypothetical protein